MRKAAPFLLGALAVLALILLLTGILDHPVVFTDMCETRMTLPRGDTLALDKGDSYGLVCQGPGFNVDAGTYRLKWVIESDGVNRIRISSANNARITGGEILTVPGETSGEAVFTLEDAASGLDISTYFEGGTFIRVRDFRLYTPTYRDNTFSALLLLAALAAFLILVLRGFSFRDHRALLLVGLALLYASVPDFKANTGILYDTPFHVARFFQLASGLREGMFPVRLAGFAYDGYGAVNSVFYPDLLLYPGALVLIFGCSMVYVLHLYHVFLNVLAAVSMYLCARRLFRDRTACVVSTILYVLCMYRFTDIYVRAALGEAAAMSVLPLFVAGLWEVFFGERRAWPLLSVSAALIFLSHMISTFLCLLLALALSALFLIRLIRRKRFASLLLAAGCCALLCAFQLAPLLTYLRQGVGAAGLQMNAGYFALAPAQLLLWGEGDLPVDPRDLTLSGMPLELGFHVVLGCVLCVLCLARRPKDSASRAALFCLLTGLATAFMSTTFFPWSQAAVLTRGFINYIQFAWRLLMFPSVFLALAAGYGYVRFIEDRSFCLVTVLALSILMILPTVNRQTRFNDYLEPGQITSPHMLYEEYTLPGTVPGDTLVRGIETQGPVSVSDFSKTGTRLSCSFQAEDSASLILPLFAFDGYRLLVNGSPRAYTAGPNNRIRVEVLPGEQGQLTLRFAGKPLWRVADLISALTLAALAVLRKRSRPPCPASPA